MANRDLANGFLPVGVKGGGELPGPRAYNAVGGTAFVVGAFVRLTSGQVGVANPTAGALLGVVAGQNGYTRLGDTCIASATTNQDVFVYDHPMTIFEGQCEGTATSAQTSDLCDWSGAAGAMEVALGTSTESTLQVEEIVEGPTESRGNQVIGANSLIRFTISKHERGNTASRAT